MEGNELFDESKILILDDRLEHLLWMDRLLQWAGYKHVEALADQRAAIERAEAIRPDLIILDLVMPGMSGFEVMAKIRESLPPKDYLPILVFTSDESVESRNRALEGGASDFLNKPGEATEILLRVKNFLEARWMHKQLRHHNEILEQRVQERTAELEEARFEALAQLARVAEFHDDETGEHTKRVGDLSARIAERMGLPRNEVELIRVAAPLHDIGKIGVSESILRKPGKLDPDEFEAVKRHTVIGGEILARSRSPVLKLAREIALFHHERWDGAGYCANLKEDQIPVPARIVAIADVYDALTHERPYKPAWTEEQARREIASQRGKQFDPGAVDAFLNGNYVRDRLPA
jgi:putative two-component system response regulator